MDQALSTPRTLTALDAWATDALGDLGALPHVHRAGLALTEGGGRRLLFTATDRVGDSPLEWCHIDAYDDVPLTQVVRRNVVLLRDLDDLGPRYAAFARAKKEAGSVALAAAPLTADGAVLGGLLLYFDDAAALAGQNERRLRELGETWGERLAHARRSRRNGHRRHVVTPPEHLRHATHDIPADPAAVPEARQAVRRTLDGWGLDAEVVGDVLLCLSEVVTNALIHTEGGCQVELLRGDEVLVVRVHDEAPTDRRHVPGQADPLEIHGRGLQIVEALASRSGRDGEHAVSWFEFDL